MPAERVDIEASHLEHTTQHKPRDLVAHELVTQLAFNRFRFYRFLQLQEEAYANLNGDNWAAQYFEPTISSLDRARQKSLLLLRELQQGPKQFQIGTVEGMEQATKIPTRSASHSIDSDWSPFPAAAEKNGNELHPQRFAQRLVIRPLLAAEPPW